MTPPLLGFRTGSRPRLLALTMTSSGFACTIVRAPAGYGKSAFLAQWYAAQSPDRRAWLSLDQYANHPVSFWSGVVEELHRAQPEFGAATLEALRSPTVRLAPALTRLLDELAALNGRLALVLDDLHEVSDPEILDSLDWLLRQHPPNLQLVVGTRKRPDLSLGAMRASGHLIEISEEQLRFDRGEAGELLRGYRPDLLDRQVTTVWEETRGWAVGLALAGMGLMQATDVDEYVTGFDGRDDLVADYLLDEVLKRLPPEDQQWVLSTSVLDHLEAEACDEITGSIDSGERLRRLSTDNVLIARLDRHGKVYRYHDLFAQFLRKRLTDTDRLQYRDVHRRSAEHFIGRGEGERAFFHAVAASEPDVAARASAGSAYRLISSGRANVLRAQVEELGTDLVGRHPELALATALLTVLEGADDTPNVVRDLVGAAEDATDAQGHDDGDFSWHAEALRSSFTYLPVEEVREKARHLLEADGPDDLRGIVLLGLTMAEFFAGHLEAARAANEQVLRRLDRGVSIIGDIERVLALGQGALVASELGDLERAETMGRAALALAYSIDDENPPEVVFYAEAAVGRTELRHRRFGAAENHLNEALDKAPPWGLPRILVRIELAILNLECHDPITARRHLAAASAAIERHPGPGLLRAQHRRIAARVPTASPDEAPPSVEDLTERELEVLGLLSTSLTNREIAGRLFVSNNTVKSHLKSIYRKLGVKSRDEAVIRASEMGLTA